MLKNKPLIIFITILIAIIIIAISVVVSVYNKNKPIVPDNSVEVVSSNDMQKIKKTYESEGKKEEFLKVCSDIELAIANKFLNGTITNDDELAKEIEKINGVLKSKDWSYIGVKHTSYWMGDWQLDEKGSLTFTFSNTDIKPSWAQDSDVNKYIK